MADVLALDLGSSSVRALVLEDGGAVRAIARRPVELQVDGEGKAEIDVVSYFDKVIDCLDELQAQGKLTDVSDVAMSSQWHSLVAVDGHGQPLTAALTWADTRAADGSTTGSRRRIDAATEEALHARTGAWVHPQYWSVKAPWLLHHAPSAVALLGLPELLTLRLLGDGSSSTSIASGTGLLDWFTGQWDAQAVDLAAVPRQVLPPLQEPHWQGRLLPEWQRRWPALGADAVWHPAVGDGAAANIGTGCVDASAVNVTIGTSTATRVVEPRTSAGQLPADLWRYRVDRDRVVSGVAQSAGGGSFAWLRNLSALPRTDGDPPGLADVPPGSCGVTVLPFHAGTRAPRDVRAARGVMSGLGLATTAAHLLSATMEAVCFEIAEAVEVIERYRGAAVDVVASGGAVQASPVWSERLAAVLGRPVHFVRETEVSARGAALVHLPPGAFGERHIDVVEPAQQDVDALAAARAAFEALRRLHGISAVAARQILR